AEPASRPGVRRKPAHAGAAPLSITPAPTPTQILAPRTGRDRSAPGATERPELLSARRSRLASWSAPQARACGRRGAFDHTSINPDANTRTTHRPRPQRVRR